MKRHVFTLSPFPTGERWSLRVPELVHQMVRVLKLRTGEEVMFVDGQGKRVEAEIVGYSEQAVEVRIQAASQEESEQMVNSARKPKVICAAILKKDHFEWLTEKLAEVGITDLIPLVSARTIKKEVRVDRLQTIAREAMEQSEQAQLMTIHQPTDVMGALRLVRQRQWQAAVCDTGKGYQEIRAYLQNKEVQVLFIGPEGGWSDEERACFEQEGKYTFVSLGDSILRGETAGILAGYELARRKE